MINSWFLPPILELIGNTLHRIGASEDCYHLLCQLRDKVQKMIEESPYSTKEELDNAIKDEYGVLYSADGTKLIKCDSQIHAYNVKLGTKVICDNAFRDCCIRVVNLPNTIVSIGCSAFTRSCINSLAIPDSVREIGYESMDRCNSLNYVSLPKNIKVLSQSMFLNSKVIEIDLPNGLKVIERGCFMGCPFSEITIPQLVETIEDEVFANCANLKTITFQGGLVNKVGKDIFKNCEKLEYIIVPQGKKDKYVSLFSDIDSKIIHEKAIYGTNK